MNTLINIFLAFITCGTFCFIAQIILDNTKFTTGHVTSLFVVIGVILEFFDIYKYIKEVGKMGASIPISSFGSAIMEGVKSSIDSQGFIGVFSGIFSNCGTLVAFAIFVAFISTLFFRAKS